MIARTILVLLLATATSGVAEPKRNPYVTTPPMIRARSQATPRPAAPRVAVADSKALVEAPARRRDNPYAARKSSKR